MLGLDEHIHCVPVKLADRYKVQLTQGWNVTKNLHPAAPSTKVVAAQTLTSHCLYRPDAADTVVRCPAPRPAVSHAKSHGSNETNTKQDQLRQGHWVA